MCVALFFRSLKTDIICMLTFDLLVRRSLVYDVTDSKTLDSLAQWKSDFIDQVGIEEEDEFAFVVVGNKVDLEATRQVQRSKGEAMARELGAVAHFETSAKTAHNVEKTFHMAASTALKRTAARKPYVVYEKTETAPLALKCFYFSAISHQLKTDICLYSLDQQTQAPFDPTSQETQC